MNKKRKKYKTPEQIYQKLIRDNIRNADVCINDIIEDIEKYDKIYHKSFDFDFTFMILGHVYNSTTYMYNYKWTPTLIEFSNTIVRISKNYEYIDINCTFDLLKTINFDFINQSVLTTTLKNDKHIYTMTAKCFIHYLNYHLKQQLIYQLINIFDIM